MSAPLVIERTVRRFYVNGRGYASKAMAYYQLAKKELVAEFEAQYGPFVTPDGKGPAYIAMTEKYAHTCLDCGERGERCGCNSFGGSFNSNAWHADIRQRAKEIAAREDSR